jgi:hypothetical protein
MPYRHVLHLPVLLPVARAVVLDLDDDAAYFTMREVQHILNDGRLPALPAHIADQHGQPATRNQRVIAPLQADHQHLAELFVIAA